MNAILQLSLEYIVTFAPVILAGAMNILWVKVGWSKLRYPLDHNLVLKDGLTDNNVESTVQNVGVLTRDGMKQTDHVIIDLMTKHGDYC